MRKQQLHPRTAIINQKQKHQSKQTRLTALRWLAETFPKAFDNSSNIQPLKLGIMDDLLAFTDKAKEAGISKSKLREAVVVYTRRIDYLTSLKAQDARIDLNGNPVGTVTEEEAERAAGKIKKRVEKSAKHARKNSPTKQSPYYGSRSNNSYHANTQDKSNNYYADTHNNSYQNSPSSTPKSPSVVIKHKANRQYDPEAVARLKKKLGLANKEEIFD